jgi:poly(3-hydroxybutyrate) depolymerase
VLTFHGLADPQNPYAGHVQGRNDEWIESVPDALAGWARRDGCRGDAILEDPPGPLSTMHYDGCAPGSEVRIIRIDGLGHQWTHKEVDTGLAMSLNAFERPADRYVAVNCPHCGRRHEFHMDAAKLAIN